MNGLLVREVVLGRARLRAIISFVLDFVLVLTAFIVHLPRVLHESLHMDEAYYVDAAQRILEGDLFLSQVQFDKPFLAAWMHLPGLLTFGKSALGFHVAGFFCFLGFLLVLRRLASAVLCLDRIDGSLKRPLELYGACAENMGSGLRSANGGTSGLRAQVLAFALSFACAIHPYMIVFMSGAFTEGPLLLVSAFFMRAVVNLGDSKTVGIGTVLQLFVVMFCLKQTALLIYPVVFILIYLEMVAGGKGPVGSIFRSVTFQWCHLRERRLLQVFLYLYLCYSVFGQQKFASIALLFQKKFHDSASGSTGLAKLVETAEAFFRVWSPVPSLSLMGMAVLAIVCLSVAAVLAREWQANRASGGGVSERLSSTLTRLGPGGALGIGLLMHVILLLKSPTQSERYHLLFWMHLVACLVLVPRSFAGLWVAGRFPTLVRLNPREILLGSFIISIAQFPGGWERFLPPREWARTFAAVEWLLPMGSVVHQKSLLWYLNVYNPKVTEAEKNFRIASHSPLSMAMERMGEGPFQQYELTGDPHAGTMPVLKPAFRPDWGDQIAVHAFEIAHPALSERGIREAFRLKNWVTESFGLNDRGQVELRVSRTFGALSTSLTIAGGLDLSRGKIARAEWGQGRTVLTLAPETFLLSLRVLGYQVPQWDLSLLLSALYRPVFRVIGPIPVGWEHPTEVSVQSVDAESGRVKFLVTEILQRPLQSVPD